MKELFLMIRRFDLKGLFITPTKNSILQFFRYVFVGGIATVADWGILYFLTSAAGIHHLVSAVISFLAGLAVNFVLSRFFVFKADEARFNASAEFIGYGLIGAAGLGITEAIMFVMTDRLSVHYMISKMTATAIVLVWNYIARKKIIYR